VSVTDVRVICDEKQRVPRPSSAWAGPFSSQTEKAAITDEEGVPRYVVTHALGIAAFPGNRPATLPHFQLLQATAKLRNRSVPDYVRDFSRTGTTTLRTLRVRLCRDARAHPHAGKRTRAGLTVATYAVAEAVGRSDIGPTSSRPVLAGSILRFQRMERAQVCGEAPLHSPESGNPRISCAFRRLALEQLPSLCK
jgi:hypothetical protein